MITKSDLSHPKPDESAPAVKEGFARLIALLEGGRFVDAVPMLDELLSAAGLDPELRDRLSHLRSRIANGRGSTLAPQSSQLETPPSTSPPVPTVPAELRTPGRRLIGAWNYYETLSRDNFMFLSPDAGIGDNLLKPLNDLHAAAKTSGIDLVTLDLLPDPGAADAYLFFDIPSPGALVEAAMRSDRPKYLVLFESEIIRPDEWLDAAHLPFSKVFTWNDRLAARGEKYVLLRWPYEFTGTFESRPLAGRKLCTMIAGNKSASDPRELYSRRVEVVRWFERQHPESFDLYGPGWEGFPSWGGRVDSKRETLGRYAFSVCFENACGIEGWVTEKIFDCLAAGCVPIYLGAPNIADFVPRDCFIDFNDFPSMEALYEHLSSMDEARYARHQEAIGCFIAGGGAPGFSVPDFSATLLRELSAPEVSVVIPSYNYGRFLGIAIESVLAQELPSLELVILDNASTDDTPDVVRPFLADPRLRYIRNEATIPVTDNWNKAVSLARGEFLAILSADDFLLPGHLGRLLRELRANPGCDLAYTPCLRVDEKGTPIGKAGHPGHPARSGAGGRDEFPELLAMDCYVTPSAALIRRSALPEPVFDPMVRGAIDWSLWVRMARQNPSFVFVDAPTCAYRVHGDQDSNDFYASTHPLDDHLRILEQSLSSPERERLIGHGRRIAHLLDIRASRYDAARLEPFLARISAVKEGLASFDAAPAADEDQLPLVTVVIPTYNRPGSLADAVRSVLAQSYPNVEVVVVNDGGECVDRLLSEIDPAGRVTSVRHGRNRERSCARNNGLRLARGHYVGYLDDDDVLYPDHIRTLVGRMRSTGARVAYSDACRAVQVPREGGYEVVDRSVPYSRDFSLEQMLVCNYIPILCLLHERSLIDEVGGFDESLSTHEDWDLLIRMALRTSFLHVPTVTSEFSWRNDGTSTSSSRRADFARTTRIVHGKYARFAATNPLVLDAQARHRASIEGTAGGGIAFSIVIPVFNNLDYTKACIESIAANTGDDPPYELIVVDNASTDGTGEFLASLGGDVRIVSNPGNLGFSKACNQGAAAARGSRIVFLNNDTVVHPGWLEGLRRAFDIHQADICGAKLLYPDGTIQHAGVVFDALNRPYHLFRGSRGDARYVNEVREFRCVTAACMGIRTELFHELGCFDEEYLNGFEDVDFCLRAADRGFRIVYTPECVVTHFESKTPGRSRFDKENLDRLQSKWDGKIRCDDLEACRSFDLIAFRMSDGRAMFLDMGGELTPEREDTLLATDPASVPFLVAGLPKKELLAKFHAVAGGILARRRMFDEATVRYRFSVDLGYTGAMPDLGDCLSKAGRLDEAQACYMSALGLEEGKSRARIGLGTLALIAGKPGEAAGWFREVVGIEPGNTNALCGLGMAAMAAGDVEGALEAYGKALDADPANLTAVHELVKLAFGQGRFDVAETRIRKSLEFEPSNAHLLFSLAGICHKQGKKADALDALDRLDLFSPGYDGSEQLRSRVTA